MNEGRLIFKAPLRETFSVTYKSIRSLNLFDFELRRILKNFKLCNLIFIVEKHYYTVVWESLKQTLMYICNKGDTFELKEILLNYKRDAFELKEMLLN